MPVTGIYEELRRAIQQAGYYPALVLDALGTALGGEDPRAFIVHHEPHFDREEIRRDVAHAAQARAGCADAPAIRRLEHLNTRCRRATASASS